MARASLAPGVLESEGIERRGPPIECRTGIELWAGIECLTGRGGGSETPGAELALSEPSLAGSRVMMKSAM